MFEYKQTKSLEERTEECRRVTEHHLSRVPVIVERGPSSSLRLLERSKFLCPGQFKGHQLIVYVRNQLALPKETALFLWINGKTMVQPDSLLSVTYDRHKDEDGFLYVLYTDQETMG